MAIVRLSLQKNPFLGLFFRASDKLLLCPKSAPHKTVSPMVEALGVEPVHLFVDQSPLIGLLSAMNAHGVVLPDFSEKEEQEILKKRGLNVMKLACFAPGNNILVNDSAALVSPAIPARDVKRIGDCFGVEVLQTKIAGFNTIGALNIVTNKGFFACNEASDEELKQLEKIFKVSAGKGTANLGSPCNGLSLTANSKGAAVGEMTTGFEVQRVYDALSLE
ncbi:translation initiation factor IF-6 [Candidatus Micrarchaeota archaeon]|nr:translation initiation factor IF-6 [Candidatus Micrarchaeota archaeon]